MRKKNYKQKMIFVKEENLEAWDWLKQHADKNDKSVSQLIAYMINAYKRVHGNKKDS